MPSEGLARYSRQVLLPEIGLEGQEILFKARAIIVGCGALGCFAADHLARAGIGHLTVVDRDIVEIENLQRQMLFTENDIGKPKARAAAETLKAINSEIEVKGLVKDLNPTNVDEIIEGIDVVLDGTDNMETRYLINDICVKNGIPWVYGGAVSTYGMSMNIIPKETACLKCAFPHIPKPGSLPTCDTVGVINTIPSLVASIQSTEALKIMLGKDVCHDLFIIDAWNRDFQRINITRKDDCQCCGKHSFRHLRADQSDLVTSLCGRNAVQISPAIKTEVSLENLAQRLEKVGSVERGPVHLLFEGEGVAFSIFKDGRVIVKGTDDIKYAKSLYAKYIGN